MVKVRITEIKMEEVKGRTNWANVLSTLKKGEAYVIPLSSLSATRKRLAPIEGLEFGKNTDKKEAYVYWANEPQKVVFPEKAKTPTK